MCSKGRCIGIALAAFGVGLLLGLCFPTKFMIIILAIAIIALGLIVVK